MKSLQDGLVQPTGLVGISGLLGALPGSVTCLLDQYGLLTSVSATLLIPFSTDGILQDGVHPILLRYT